METEKCIQWRLGKKKRVDALGVPGPLPGLGVFAALRPGLTAKFHSGPTAPSGRGVFTRPNHLQCSGFLMFCQAFVTQ